MALTSGQVVVSTTATALNAAGSGQKLHLSNPAGQTVFLGNSAVTTTTGYALAASTTRDIEIGPGEVLYGIVAATTATVSVLRTGAP